MSDEQDETSPDQPGRPLRRGWTTGACATAATRAACEALAYGAFPDPVEIVLPGGQQVAFALASCAIGEGWARAAIVKDAGDDPDVTHGATIEATVRPLPPGAGVVFRAGPGVGTVTRPGLPIPPGEPAINPVPRDMMRAAVVDAARRHGAPRDVEIEVSIPGGEKLAAKTLNTRLGIVGGLSILGTTGIVVPYSCAAWIHAIHRGIDVARAAGIAHIAGATGSTSERAVQQLYSLPEIALIDMGDFVGGMLKYLRDHPVPRVTIAGGFAKMTKLGQGLLDLHSRRGRIDNDWLAALLEINSAPPALVAAARSANTALHVLQDAERLRFPVGPLVAAAALETSRKVIQGTPLALDIVVFDRVGNVVGQAA